MSTVVLRRVSFIITFMALLLCACLPEGSTQSPVARRGEDAISSARADSVGDALTSYALRSQYVLTSDAAWRAGTVPEGAIKMGRFDMGSAGALATSAFCRDASGRAYHLTWTKRSQDAGGRNVASLSRRASSDMVGMADAKGVISLQNGKAIKLSAACLKSGTVTMPTNAVVLAMAMSLPTEANLAGRTNVMFETAACSGPREAGYELVKVISRYDADGRMKDGYPKRSVVSTSCAEQTTVDAQVTASTSQIVSNAGGFGTSGIAKLVGKSLGDRVPCAVTRQVEVTGYDKKGRPEEKTIESMDSCNAVAIDTAVLGSYSDTDLSWDYWEINEELGYCKSGAASRSLRLFDTPGIWSWSNWEGEYTSKRSVNRTRTTTSDSKEDKVNAIRGPWVGDTIDCSRQEKFRADCADISAVRALGKPYASNQMWVNVDILNDANRHFDADWIRNLFGGTVACWFGCDKLVSLDVDIMNKDYFDGLEVSGELHMKRNANISHWDDAATFAPHVPREAEKGPWLFNSTLSTCAVSVRTPLFTCKGSSEERPTVSPRSVAAANVIRHDLLAKLYSYPRTSDGAVMTTLDPDIDRKYLILGGKYPSEYSVKKLHWAVKSCSVKGCDTDHQERMVYRIYIDRDKSGYQKVLDQGFYYASKKVMYDLADGFYVTDRGVEPSADDVTRCEVMRLEGRKIHNLSYTVRFTTPAPEGKGMVIHNYQDRNIISEFMESDLTNYIARGERSGYITNRVSKNICILEEGPEKYCSSDPYVGKSTIACNEIGMYAAQDCVLYSSGGDDSSCKQWKHYCTDTKAPDYLGSD